MREKKYSKLECPKCGEVIKTAITAADMGKKGGSSRSKAKLAAQLLNCKKGGRPRKDKK